MTPVVTLLDIQGHWQREWIKAPDFEDHTTRVHWMQCGSVYADVRMPLERPDLGKARALADLPAQGLYALSMAEGFAGRVTLEGTRCTWQRDVNWHGTPEASDIGDISFDDQGRMIETGVAAEYTELWAYHDAPDRQAHVFSNGHTLGYLVTSGTDFVLGIGQPDRPATTPIRNALAAGQIPKETQMLFEGLHALGHWDGPDGIAGLATNPFCENKRVVTLTETGLIWHCVDFHGQTTQITLPSHTNT